MERVGAHADAEGKEDQHSVTTLLEKKKAELVIIANDPLEDFLMLNLCLDFLQTL